MRPAQKSKTVGMKFAGEVCKKERWLLLAQSRALYSLCLTSAVLWFNNGQ